MDLFDTQGDAMRLSAASLCPELNCCRTFGAHCIGADSKRALRAILLLVLLSAAPAFAQPPAIDPPIVGRPDGFSNIVGKYNIHISAEPTDVQVEEAITLRIRIVGSGQEKYEPARKHLHPLFLDTWKDDFYVQEMPDEHQVLRDQKAWLFTYRLKPRHAKIDVIPRFDLVYYDPSIAGKNKFVTEPADPIKVTVKPKPARLDIEVPPAVPDSFYEQAASTEVLVQAPPWSLSGITLAAALLAVPGVCLIGALAWRRIYPDERGLTDRRRTQAAERALADLRAGSESPWAIVCRYLRERLDFAAQDATPREVARFLKRRGFALERCAQSEAFFQVCDAIRYTGARASDAGSLAAEAVTLIQTLEADPCLRA